MVDGAQTVVVSPRFPMHLSSIQMPRYDCSAFNYIYINASSITFMKLSQIPENCDTVFILFNRLVTLEHLSQSRLNT